MKKVFTAALIIAVFTTLALSQKLTQTVRGTILDTDSNLPLIGAGVLIPGNDALIGTATDLDGNFRLENIPIGRISLRFSYLGYEDKVIPNIVVNSGKEVVLNLDMQESAVLMEEVVIRPDKKKGEALNDMSLLSARSISAEETKRYPGGFNDPSRIMSNFAGVTSNQDGSNDIIVRGNSPKYVQWRLEGIEITNPNHFADQNGSGNGGIGALNNNLLATSDFYTGAFSPEYGDVLSGVYDLRLRAGNNERFESTFGFGLLGTDLMFEGPFKKGYGGSYLVNYRYSTASLINDLGLIDIGGNIKFQDAAFKVVLPTQKAGVFSFFGLGGWSVFSVEDVQPEDAATPGNQSMRPDIREDVDKSTYQATVGMNHTLPINKNSYVKTSLSYSTSGIDDDIFESKTVKTYNDQDEFVQDSVVSTMLNLQNRIKKSTYRGSITYNNKLNAKNKIQIGSKYTLFDYDFEQSWLQDDGATRFTTVDFRENIGTLRNFVSWKYRLNEDITIVSGFHNMNVLFNSTHTLEPRVAVKWRLNNTSSIHAGYGKHSNMETIHNYFVRVEQEDGSVIEPNKNLGLLKADHFILGFEKRFTKNLMAKVEVYYQGLYDLPVENDETSYYATINEDLEYKYVDLVNKGTGKNYGVEVTLERFFDNNYYYLINASLYNSKYKSLEGVERNTRYNGNYVANILFGKEFTKLGRKRNQTLALNTKAFFGGGKKIIPLLRDAQGNLAVNPANDKYWDYENAYENKIEDVHEITVSASYKWNKPKATHEIFIDLINVTNTKDKLYEYYNENAPNSIGHVTQFGFFPNLMYRVYF